MANRVIKDTIWDSPTLAKLAPHHEDQFPRWLLLADDWGCFNANPERIKGLVFPNRKTETPAKISTTMQAFHDVGLLFLWEEDGRSWGYFVSFDSHHSYCNNSSMDDSGKRSRHRRKTPEPPKALLDIYLHKLDTNGHKLTQVDATLTQLDTKCAKPKPKPKPKNPLFASQVLEDLNRRTGAKFDPTAESHLKLIRQRAKEGHSLEDFLAVNASKFADWGADEKMGKFLRPSTLYGTKFAEYLGASTAVIVPESKQTRQEEARGATDDWAIGEEGGGIQIETH